MLGVSSTGPSLGTLLGGPLLWERPLPGRYPTLITVAFVPFVCADVWGEKGVEGVLCVAYFRGGPLLVLKLIRMARTA
jgi:hypothetical protein